MAKSREEAASTRARSDGRRQLLLYISPEVIRELKRAAIDADKPAYELAELAIAEFLKTRKARKK
jgi:hypothetical protein